MGIINDIDYSKYSQPKNIQEEENKENNTKEEK